METILRTIRYAAKDGTRILVEQYRSPYGISLWRYGAAYVRPEHPIYTVLSDNLRTRPSMRTLRGIAGELTLEYDSRQDENRRMANPSTRYIVTATSPSGYKSIAAISTQRAKAEDFRRFGTREGYRYAVERTTIEKLARDPLAIMFAAVLK